MMNERKTAGKKPAGRTQAAAKKFRELREVKKNDFQAISREMEAAGLPGLAVAHSDREPDMAEQFLMTKQDIIDRVNQAESFMSARTREAIEAVHDLQDSTFRRMELVDQRLATLTTQTGLIQQLLKALDPVRIDQAVQALTAARTSYEAPPLKQTVREAAAAIRAGERPPRRKLGVTIDGALWAAVEDVQKRRRCTISDILDEALEVWLQDQGQA